MARFNKKRIKLLSRVLMKTVSLLSVSSDRMFENWIIADWESLTGTIPKNPQENRTELKTGARKLRSY